MSSIRIKPLQDVKFKDEIYEYSLVRYRLILLKINNIFHRDRTLDIHRHCQLDITLSRGSVKAIYRYGHCLQYIRSNPCMCPKRNTSKIHARSRSRLRGACKFHIIEFLRFFWSPYITFGCNINIFSLFVKRHS